jgi:membrane dipeptidase
MPNEIPNTEVARSAQELMKSSVVWDNVWPVDLPGHESIGNGWDSLERFAAAGVNVVGVTLAGDNHNSSEALRLAAWARSELRSRSSRLALVESVADITAAKRAGKLGVVLQFEGTRCFERDLNLIDAFYALGVRQTLLAFNVSNCAGGGCADAKDGGLTPYGARVIREAERVGMLIDLSHVGRRTSLEALEVARKPMVFSHSNAGALHQSFRNIDDIQARACAASGGLIGISGSSEYLGDVQCRTETLFRHLDHYVQLVGAQHVGMGLDLMFNPEPMTRYARARPEEWPMARDPAWGGFNYAVPTQVLELTELMIAHGYAREAIQGLLGGNYMRISAQVWT